MKKNLTFVLMLLFNTYFCFADAITEMPKWQAEKIASYLEGEKYIFPYCDCCQLDPLQVVQYEKVSIEPFSENLYQVRLRGTLISTFTTDELGNSVEAKNTEKIYNDLVSNYTFVSSEGKLINLFKAAGITMIDDSEIPNCQPFLNLPDPSKIGNQNYLSWYNKNVQKEDFDKLVQGSWNLNYIVSDGQNIYADIPKWKMNLRENKTYFTTIGDGGTGVWRSDSDYIILKSDDSGKESKIPYQLLYNHLYMKFANDKGTGCLVFMK